MSCDHQATILPCPKHKQTILTLDANDTYLRRYKNIKHKQSKLFQSFMCCLKTQLCRIYRFCSACLTKPTKTFIVIRTFGVGVAQTNRRELLTWVETNFCHQAASVQYTMLDSLILQSIGHVCKNQSYVIKSAP